MMIRFATLFGVAALFAFAAGPVAAGPLPSLVPAVAADSLGCGCSASERAELSAYRDRIAGAESVESARELALAQTRLAERALRGALWLAPRSEGIEKAHARIAEYEARVAAATTPDAISAEFGELVQLASLNGAILSDADFRADTECDYTGGEIVAIVIGFILGIIPGVILLFLLC